VPVQRGCLRASAVTKQLDDWPEKDQRDIIWVALEQAAAKVSEPGLRDVLKNFRRYYAAHRPTQVTRRRG
jgi:P2-related tail formation protein